LSGAPGFDGPTSCGPGCPLSRRQFLNRAARSGVKAASLPLALELLLSGKPASAAGAAPFEREVYYYRKLPDRKIQCFVCPFNCVLKPGETCFCRSRINVDGTLYSRGWGKPCIVSIDPIEKLPFGNCLPGEKVVSLAVGGCNLRCLYCQNWEQSQEIPDKVRPVHDLDPGAAVASTRKKKIRTIAFTYTEPIAFYEYMIDIAAEAGAHGIRTVAGTALFANRRPVRDACRHIDAFAVTLKGFDQAFYRKVCGADLKPVLAALEEIRSEGRWLELTSLIVPTFNDDMKKIRDMARWIRRNLGADVPWHFSRFVPRYKLANLPRTPIQTLEDARKTALDQGIDYVYTSNIAPHEGNNTYCPRCGRTLIERVGFKIIKNFLEKGRCPCGRKIAGIFEHEHRGGE